MLGTEPRASMPVKHCTIENFLSLFLSWFKKSKFVLIRVFYLQNECENVFITVFEFSPIISNISKRVLNGLVETHSIIIVKYTWIMSKI